MPERVCFRCGFTHDGDKVWCEPCIKKAKEKAVKPQPKGSLRILFQEIANGLAIFIAVISMLFGL